MTHWRKPPDPPTIGQVLLTFIVAALMLIVILLGMHFAHV